MATKTVLKSKEKSASTSKKKVSYKPAAMYRSVRESVDAMPIIGKIVAEFIGTFLLTVAFVEMQGNPLFIAFALAGITFVVGGVSGSHLNPAVSFGAWVTRKIDGIHALAYVAAQVLGASAAYGALKLFLEANKPAANTFGASSNLFSAATISADKEWYIFFAELLASAVLVLGVATALRFRENRTAFALASAFALMTGLYIGMALTNNLLTAQGTLAFLNPAIAFAGGGLKWDLWAIAIYALAPVLAGVVAFALQDFFNRQQKLNQE